MLISPNVNPSKLSSCAQPLRHVTQPSCLPLTLLSPGHSVELDVFCHLREEIVQYLLLKGNKRKKCRWWERRWCSFTKHKIIFIPVPAARHDCWVTGAECTSANMDAVLLQHLFATRPAWSPASCLCFSWLRLRGNCSAIPPPSPALGKGSRGLSIGHWVLSSKPKLPELVSAPVNGTENAYLVGSDKHSMRLHTCRLSTHQ